MMIAILLAAAAPSAEAQALGAELGRLGMAASFLPSLARKEIEDLVAAHPELGDADKATLRSTAQSVADTKFDTFYAAVGQAYASALSIEDLRAVVAFERSPVAGRYRAALPAVMMESAKALQGFDFKAQATAAFCAKTGKLCPPK